MDRIDSSELSAEAYRPSELSAIISLSNYLNNIKLHAWSHHGNRRELMNRLDSTPHCLYEDCAAEPKRWTVRHRQQPTSQNNLRSSDIHTSTSKPTISTSVRSLCKLQQATMGQSGCGEDKVSLPSVHVGCWFAPGPAKTIYRENSVSKKKKNIYIYISREQIMQNKMADKESSCPYFPAMNLFIFSGYQINLFFPNKQWTWWLMDEWTCWHHVLRTSLWFRKFLSVKGETFKVMYTKIICTWKWNKVIMHCFSDRYMLE